jgi:hypothetical protein
MDKDKLLEEIRKIISKELSNEEASEALTTLKDKAENLLELTEGLTATLKESEENRASLGEELTVSKASLEGAREAMTALEEEMKALKEANEALTVEKTELAEKADKLEKDVRLAGRVKELEEAGILLGDSLSDKQRAEIYDKTDEDFALYVGTLKEYKDAFSIGTEPVSAEEPVEPVEGAGVVTPPADVDAAKKTAPNFLPVAPESEEASVKVKNAYEKFGNALADLMKKDKD